MVLALSLPNLHIEIPVYNFIFLSLFSYIYRTKTERGNIKLNTFVYLKVRFVKEFLWLYSFLLQEFSAFSFKQHSEKF